MGAMYLLVGLGNPGAQYERTRHNIGFRMADFLREQWGLSAWKEEKDRKALVSRGRVGMHDVLLAKPQTFMNVSGEAVSALMHFYRVPLDHVVVLYDDVDLPLGEIRFRAEGSAGTHNGMRSIVGMLGKAFPRLRFGIETRKGRVPDTSSFVLSKFTKEEEKMLPDLFAQGKQELELHVFDSCVQ